jgi:cell volume regulation protein A
MALNIDQIIALFGAIVFIGFFAEIMFRKFSVPNIIILLLLGLILGSFTGTLSSEDLSAYASLFAPIALIIILFEGGLNMNLLEFIKESPLGIAFSFIMVLLSIFLFSILGYILFGWDLLIGAILGSIVGGISSAIALPLVKNGALSAKAKNIISIESVATDVFCIVMAISLINIAVGISTLDITVIIKEILLFFLIGTVIGGIGAFFWAGLLKFTGKIDFSYILTIGFLFILYYISGLMGGNGPITALIFGLFLGNLNLFAYYFKTDKFAFNTFFIKKFHNEITFFISTFFFVYLGTIVVFKNFNSILIGIFISCIIIVMRYVIVKIFFSPFNIPQKQLQIMSILSARGLAAAVLAPLPFYYGIQGTESFSDIVFSVIICTVIFTVLGYIYLTKMTGDDLSEKITKVEKKKDDEEQDENEKEDNKEEEDNFDKEIENFEFMK